MVFKIYSGHIGYHLQLRFYPGGRCESVASLDMYQYLIVGKSLKREASKGDDLIENDSVAPNIRHWSEDSLRQTFGRHPPDRKHTYRYHISFLKDS